jgi:hypothetical protein
MFLGRNKTSSIPCIGRNLFHFRSYGHFIIFIQFIKLFYRLADIETFLNRQPRQVHFSTPKQMDPSVKKQVLVILNYFLNIEF